MMEHAVCIPMKIKGSSIMEYTLSEDPNFAVQVINQ